MLCIPLAAMRISTLNHQPRGTYLVTLTTTLAHHLPWHWIVSMPVPVPPEESDFSKLFVPEQQPVPPVLRETQMYFISTYPPLGGISQVPAGEVVFYLQLQVHQSLAKEPWEVALWHSSGDGASGGEWAETTLSTSRKHQVPSNLQTMDQAVVTLHFTGNLPIHSTVHFTVKFRQSGIRPWRWVRDELKIGDGLLLVEGESASKSISTDLPSLISGFNPVLRWRSEPSQCPDTLLWSIDAPVEAVKEDASALADITLGLPWGGFSR